MNVLSKIIQKSGLEPLTKIHVYADVQRDERTIYELNTLIKFDSKKKNEFLVIIRKKR